MTSKNKQLTYASQQGFTLLELLIAMMLMLVVVIGVQRYIAGVVVDQSAISERHDQVSQTRIALTNIQRNVAGAGYYPLTIDPNKSLFSHQQTNWLGAEMTGCDANGSNCQGLNVASIQSVNDARDCNGDNKGFREFTSVLPNGFSALSSNKTWAIVYNQYSIIDDEKLKVPVLKCKGNGSKEFAQPYLNNVTDSVLTFVNNSELGLPNNGLNTTVKMVSWCILTENDISGNDGSATVSDCAGNALTPPAGRAYFKTRIDMPVYSSSFVAR